LSKLRPTLRRGRGTGIDSGASTSEVSPGGPADTAADLRGKALSAVALVAGRNVVLKVVALLGYVVFARLLSPESLGTVAFGLTVLVSAQLLSDGGLGVGLIRGPVEPRPEDLSALLGFQLLLTTSLAIVIAVTAVAGPFGLAGLVTAVMMPALPLLALRTPSTIVLERSLSYGPLVRVEIAEELSFYLWATATLLLGAGVWGLASAAVLRALVGTVVILSVSPVARLFPTLSWKRLKPMLGFGIRFQATSLANAAGEQLLNLGIAVFGSFAVLGLWTLTQRLAQLPFLLFNALWRVSFPATARLMSAGESAREMIERGLGLAAVATGAILAPATGAVSPLIPLIFGSRWSPVANVLPLVFFALQASGPVSVATVGYLYAVGDTGAVLRAATATSVVWLVVTLPLLAPLGLVAVGLGWMISSFVEIPILATPVHRRTGAPIVRPILAPWVSATVGGACGLLVSREVSHGVIAALLGAGVAICIYTAPMAFLRRDEALTIWRLTKRVIRPGARQATVPS